MGPSNFSVYSLLIVSLLAVSVPLLVSRMKAIRIPIVVGEIIAGVIVGNSGFHLIQQSEWLQFLQFFGLAYLMFVSGLEIDFAALRPTSETYKRSLSGWLTSAPVFAVLTSVITLGLSYLLSERLYFLHMIRSPLLLSLIITTTSLTVVVPVLKEYGLTSHPLGGRIMAAAVMADFVTMLLISVAVSLYKGGLSPSVLLVFVLILILLLLYRLFRRFSGIAAFRNLAHGTAQLGIRASLSLMMIFIVLSETLGVQVILGTFLAGMLVGLVNPRERSDVRSKLDAIGFGFLIPIFFIMVGVDFNFRSLLHDPKALLLLPILFVATYLFKGLPAILLRLRYPWRETLAGSALLTTQMSVTVAAAAVGLKIGAISQGVDTAIILVAMLTSVISPIAFGKLLPKHVQETKKSLWIIGESAGAQLLVEQARERGEDVRWIQPHVGLENEVTLEEIAKKNIGEEAGYISGMVLYTEIDQLNLTFAKEAAKAGIQPVICLVRDMALYQENRDETEFVVVQPQFAAVSLVDQLVHYPISTQFLKAPASLQIQEIPLQNRVLHQQRLMKINLPGRLLILSIVRDGEQIVAHGETELHVGDILIVVGSREDIEAFHVMAGVSYSGRDKNISRPWLKE
ncbi:cation:proton antiporter domain-containing protein [Alicyclobacillus tolerans]|uniref:Kef-type K+ transport system membrane component KefB n=2 Tax=Alicyclobacillus TaxID=29330 RepID=A0ABT9LXW3_9BACL|nr:cation:proton antiporter [Alicyclobacillus tengchongensis]MDP9729106.1 Kef-type K+ transport system membrane component KefB [Alicyclobacillus tengchongensis]